MPIKEINIENIKIFVKPQNLKFAPITLLYGENSSGKTTLIKVLDILKSKSTSFIESTVDENLLRPVDVTLQVPEVSKFFNVTGWQPKYSIEDSVGFLLDHYRDIK